MKAKQAERKVLRVLGVTFRPTNWIILFLGFVFVITSFYQWIFNDVSNMDFLILLGTGLCMSAQGYEVVKDEEGL